MYICDKLVISIGDFMAIRTKRRAIKQKKKANRKQRKVRLAIECSPEERKYMKMFAAHEDQTLNEFVLDSVRMRLYKCSHRHTPNKETRDALEAAEKKEGLVSFDSIEDFLKSLDR